MANVQDYSFKQHLHNYSVWTASRAVQRSFTSTENIQAAIDNSSLRAFAESQALITEIGFDAFHRSCATSIIDSLRHYTGEKSTYGRAAKIIAIYLKTSVILPNSGNCSRSSIIHPPIDSILLKNLSTHLKRPGIMSKPWTTLNEVDYWGLVSEIKSIFKPFNWTLEVFWLP